MKKSRIIVFSFLVGIFVFSCTKGPVDKPGNLVTPGGISSFAVSSNGGNLTCEDVSEVTGGCTFENPGERIDYYGGEAGGEGDYGPIHWWTEDGIHLNWSSSIPVKIAVIVKGGPTASIHFAGCDEYLTEGTMLTAPINPKNQMPYGISNITFCYTEGELSVAAKCIFKAPKGTSFYKVWGISVPGDAASFTQAWCSNLGILTYKGEHLNFDLMNLQQLSSVVGNVDISVLLEDHKYYLYVVVDEVDTSIDLTLWQSYLYIGSPEGFYEVPVSSTDGCPEYRLWPFRLVDDTKDPHIYKIPLSDII